MQPVVKKGWRKSSWYTHRSGLIRERHNSIRYIFVIAVVGTASAMLGTYHFGEQIEAMITKNQPVTAKVEAQETVAPIKDLSAYLTVSEEFTLDPKLQMILQEWVAEHRSHDWSVVVKESGGDRRYAAVRADSWYVPASVYKLMSTYSLFKKYNLSQMETIYLKVNGQQRSLKSCIDAMLSYSDNPCGQAVGKHLGWWRIESDLQKAGFTNTFFNRKDAMFTSAEDAAEFMYRLQLGTLIPEDSKKYVIAMLQNQSLRSGIPKGCAGCTVANKTGDNGVKHDVGIVKSSGKIYVLSVFTSGASFSQIAELSQKINDHMTAPVEP